LLAGCLVLAGCATGNDSAVRADVAPPERQSSESYRVGQEVFAARCEACHAAGREHPGTLRLELSRGKERSVLLARRDLNAEYIKVIVRNGLLMMPPFRPTEIPDEELDSLATYVANEATRAQEKP
jgi:mono/diheme cytochrome c family protein